jgi:hypothetical protein
MAEITIVEVDFECGCGYNVYGLIDVDYEIECPRCGKVYELVYYLIPEDESEDE